MNILFMGQRKPAAHALQWLLEQGHTIAAVVADTHTPNSCLVQKCEELNIPCVSQAEAEVLVSSAAEPIDLAISYLYWRKIKEPVISGPRLGCINFHPGLLPDWKGRGVHSRAILHKLGEWGVTAHYVDQDFDTGPIIRIYRFSFDYRQETVLSLVQKTQLCQFSLFQSVMTDLGDGDAPLPAGPNEGGIYTTKRQMLDMMEIKPGDDIDLKIRAFWRPPYRGAFIRINGREYPVINEFILRQLKQISE